MPTKKKAKMLQDEREDPPQVGDAYCPVPRGMLIAIGGHEDKEVKSKQQGSGEAESVADTILQRFVNELQGNGPVLVIPTASEEPVESGEDYVKVFASMGVQRVEVLDIRVRDEVDTEENLRLVDAAAGIMFTGGDQLRLTSILGGTRFLKQIKERYTSSPLVIAGTSAGAAAMSTPMIYQGRNDAGYQKDEIHITTGLQFLHDVAIDTHFVARGRIVRMSQIIATNPGCIGIGLEEDTAIVVTNGKEVEVIGSGLVVIVDGLRCQGNTIHEIKPGEVFSIRNLHLHLLAAGQRYTIPVLEQMHV